MNIHTCLVSRCFLVFPEDFTFSSHYVGAVMPSVCIMCSKEGHVIKMSHVLVVWEKYLTIATHCLFWRPIFHFSNINAPTMHWNMLNHHIHLRLQCVWVFTGLSCSWSCGCMSQIYQRPSYFFGASWSGINSDTSETFVFSLKQKNLTKHLNSWVVNQIYGAFLKPNIFLRDPMVGGFPAFERIDTRCLFTCSNLGDTLVTAQPRVVSQNLCSAAPQEKRKAAAEAWWRSRSVIPCIGSM